ncbi:MAG TPA: hypothetical protein VIL65_02220 [Beijerinckiaceae bacterium]
MTSMINRPHLDRIARTRIGQLLRTVHLPPDTSPLPDQHLELLLALRRKVRERLPRTDG